MDDLTPATAALQECPEGGNHVPMSDDTYGVSCRYCRTPMPEVAVVTSARSRSEVDLADVAAATVTQPMPICGECYADHCWRCEGTCGCTHPDDEDDLP